MKRAYRTTWGGVVSIVAAETVAQARQRTKVSAFGAGYKPKWTEIRVMRASEYDEWAEGDSSGVACWAESDLRGMKNAPKP